MAPKWIPHFDFAIDEMAREHGRWNAEIRVAEALNEQLSKNVWVLPNLRYTVPKEDRASVSLEIDFLIVWKGKGFLILEVKGGEVLFDPNTKTWGTSKLACAESYRSPVKQVQNSRNDLCRMLKRFFPNGTNSRNYVETALVFPGIESLAGDKHHIERIDDYPVAKIIFRQDLQNIGAVLEKFLSGTSKLTQNLDPKIMGQIVSYFRPAAYGAINPKHILSKTKDAIDQVTDEQLDRIRAFNDNEFVLLSGPAGTGKTIMGLSMVDAWKKSGRDAYYVTKNPYLVEGLKNDVRFQDVKERILTLHEFVEVTTEKCLPDDRNSLLTALLGLENESRQFSVVLDEAQDITSDLYEHLVGLAPFERLWVLLDPHQVLTEKKPLDKYRIECMEHAARCEVGKNCRNVRKIAESVKALVNLPADYVWKNMARGQKAPVYIKVYSETEHDLALSEVLAEYSAKDYKESKITLISCLPGGREAVQQKYCSEDCEFTLGEEAFTYNAISESAPQVAWVNDFKGLESEIVIVADVRGTDSSFRASYMAATRAKIELTIITLATQSPKSIQSHLGSEIDFEI